MSRTLLPILTVPEGLDLWAETTQAKAVLNRANGILKKLGADAYHGVILPYGWKLETIEIEVTP